MSAESMMYVLESNRFERDGVVVAELYCVNPDYDCYQIMIGRNEKSGRMLAVVNNVTDKKTMYSGEVYITDNQEILPEHDCFIFAVKEPKVGNPFTIVHAIPKYGKKDGIVFVTEVPHYFFEV